MKTDSNWIENACQILVKTKIVTCNNTFPKEFKGYISSFAATAIQSGLLPALIIYENEDSDSAAQRHLLPKAIMELMKKFDLIPQNVSGYKSLSDMYSKLSDKDDKVRFLHSIDKATTAIKMAIRMYEPVKSDEKSETKDNKEKKSKNKNSNKPSINISDYTLDKNCFNASSNVGWLYYRDYYHDYSKNKIDIQYYYNKTNNKKSAKPQDAILQEIILKEKKNPFIFSSRLNGMLNDNKFISDNLQKNGFKPLKLKTTYPGLLIGSGLSHGTPIENDIKCGFQFDYSTGLPIIPGSSVKGVLRSAFPDKKKNETYNRMRIDYIRSLLSEQGIKCTDNDIFLMAENIFNHEKDNYDIFMDAIITNGPKDGKFIGDDYITPHKNPYKDPNPIQFIKVLPDIEFTFFFKFTPYILNKETNIEVNKIDLYRQILQDFGIGAKTNVGYGHFEEA
ncbi:type III-B CRISPR module RAMP protein Cmr6 [uncultured Bacteroides sp.]|uniref:type III-B CRISPR module RAMP protein Cmr6 n=1 Tax=uncultured Bacteroides sp. TaxID=162156 RepID=UPI0026025E14|nr:type III-B CRISPR module RAMP protein Cmr6 [uncultured Bacteroides sp.]